MALLGTVVRGGVPADIWIPKTVGAVVAGVAFSRWMRQRDEEPRPEGDRHQLVSAG